MKVKYRKTHFMADPHFGHELMIEVCKRPFKDVTDMNERIIKKYNRLVQPHDIVYFLGDIGFKNQKECRETIERLNGIKILILGNHDKWGINAYYNMGFKAVLQEAEVRIGKEWVTLSHYPRRSLITTLKVILYYVKKMRKRKRPWDQIWNKIKKEWRWTNRPTKKWHICGHVHDKWKVKGKNINVGVDVWNYQPVSYHEIVKIMQGF